MVIKQPHRGEDCITVMLTGRKHLFCEFLQGDGANSTNAYLDDTQKQFSKNKHINNLIELEIIGSCRPSNATSIAGITEVSLK